MLSLPTPMPLWLHTLFEVLGFGVGFWLIKRAKQQDTLPFEHRAVTLSAAIVGASVGCKLVALLDHPALLVQLGQTWQRGNYAQWLMLLSPGKGIVGGLMGGWLLVEAVKKAFGIRQSSGDLLVWPLTVGMVIGRVGCLLTGLADQTYGLPTTLPWAVDFGDGIGRHPAQLYEILWLVGSSQLALRSRQPFLWWMGGYCLFRLIMDNFKPVPHPYGALNASQWLACIGLAMAAVLLIKKLYSYVSRQPPL